MNGLKYNTQKYYQVAQFYALDKLNKFLENEKGDVVDIRPVWDQEENMTCFNVIYMTSL